MVDYASIGEQEILDYLKDFREIEMEELEYLYPGETLENAVRNSVACSNPKYNYSARVNGKLMCIGGVSPTEHGGQVWFLATKSLRRYGVRLAKELNDGKVIPDMLRKYGKLYNYISVNNFYGISWIKHIGFTVYESDVAGKCYFERVLVC